MPAFFHEMQAAIQRINHRLRHSLRVGRIVATKDDGAVQTAQIRLSSIELRDGTPMAYHYGFSARPPADTDVTVLFLGGDRSQGVVVATGNQKFRVKDLKEGEICVYDDLGRKVTLGRDGIVVEGKDSDVLVKTTAKVKIEAPVVEIRDPGETLRKVVTDHFMDVFNSHHHGSGPGPTPEMTADDLTAAVELGGAS